MCVLYVLEDEIFPKDLWCFTATNFTPCYAWQKIRTNQGSGFLEKWMGFCLENHRIDWIWIYPGHVMVDACDQCWWFNLLGFLCKKVCHSGVCMQSYRNHHHGVCFWRDNKSRMKVDVTQRKQIKMLIGCEKIQRDLVLWWTWNVFFCSVRPWNYNSFNEHVQKKNVAKNWRNHLHRFHSTVPHMFLGHSDYTSSCAFRHHSAALNRHEIM